MCARRASPALVWPRLGATVKRGRFKVFRQCSDHRGRALGRDINPFVVESVVTPPPCLDEGQFRWAPTLGFQHVSDTMTGCSWTVTRSRPWRWTGAARVGEAQSLVEALRLRAAVEGGRTVRVLLLGDNMAVCLAFEQRRAANFGLLRLIRCFASISWARKLRTSPSRHYHGEHHRTTCATSESFRSLFLQKKTGRTFQKTRSYQRAIKQVFERQESQRPPAEASTQRVLRRLWTPTTLTRTFSRQTTPLQASESKNINNSRTSLESDNGEPWFGVNDSASSDLEQTYELRSPADCCSPAGKSHLDIGGGADSNSFLERMATKQHTTTTQTAEEIDALLVSYVAHLFFLGYGISSAEAVLFSWASCHLGSTRLGCMKTRRLHRVLKGFRRLAPPRSRVSVAWPASAITAVLLHRQCYDEAALTLLCYGAYL